MKETEKSYLIKHRLLTPPDVAELLQISEKTVYKHQKQLGGFNPAGSGILRFKQEIINGIIERQETKTLLLQFRASRQNLCKEKLQEKKGRSNSPRQTKRRGHQPTDKNRHGLFGNG